MATKYAPYTAFVWSDNWCDSNDGVQDVVKPGIGDAAVLTVESGDCTLDEDTAALASLATVNYSGTLDLNGWDIDVDGPVITGGTTVATAGDKLYVSGSADLFADLPSELTLVMDGTGNLDLNGNTGGDIEINTAGTVTAVILQAWDSFTLTGGTYVDEGFDHNIAGSIMMDAAEGFVSTGTWTMTADGNIINTTFNRQFNELSIAEGVTATLTNTTYVKKFTGAGRAILQQIFAYLPPAAPFDSTGAHTADMAVRIDGSRDLGGISTTGGLVLFANDDYIFTATSTVGAGAVSLSSASDNKVSTLDMADHNLTCGAITLGSAPLRTGSIDFGSGAHSIGGIIANDSNNDDENLCNFATSNIALSGTIDGENVQVSSDTIAFTNTSGVVVGGTITDVDLSGEAALHAFTSVNGGGNTNVLFSAVTAEDFERSTAGYYFKDSIGIEKRIGFLGRL